MLSKIIPDFPNYRIYEDGRVQNIKTEKFLKPSPNSSKYLQLRLQNRGISRSIGIHRLLAQAFIPNPKNKPQVNHIDGNKQNNSLNNLEWVTHQENIQHAYDIGLKDKSRDLFRLKAKKVYWNHPQYGDQYCSASDLVTKFPEQKLHRGHLSQVVTKIRPHHKGWKLNIP